MTLGALAVRNVLRNKFRTVLTILGVAVAIVAFVLLRTVLTSWTVAIEHAAKDRIGTRHKITFIMQLPKRYVEEISQTPGVKSVTYANWFGGKDPKHENEFFATIACDPASFLNVYDEVELPQAERQAWFENRRGAIIGRNLAKQMGWKTGDKITLSGTIFPGDWQFEISGVYTTKRKSVDESTFWFHWDYLNDSMPLRIRDQVGWIVSRVDDPTRAADIAKSIDRRFDERDVQTLSMSERAMNLSFLGMISAALKAIDIVSIVILLIMTLILGNTIAMGVRERTNEYGVLRAIGFSPRHVGAFVLGEALTIGVAGGLLGLALSYPLVERGLGRFLEENMGGIFPYFRIDSTTAVAALALALALSIAAAVLPALGAARLQVTEALRRVG